MPGGRVVSKTHPEEKVGVFVTSGGRTKVVEYSELSSEMARAREPSSNQLQFNWGNICMHYFRVFFLEKADKMPLPYHIARKRIPSCGTNMQAHPISSLLSGHLHDAVGHQAGEIHFRCLPLCSVRLFNGSGKGVRACSCQKRPW